MHTPDDHSGDDYSGWMLAGRPDQPAVTLIILMQTKTFG